MTDQELVAQLNTLSQDARAVLSKLADYAVGAPALDVTFTLSSGFSVTLPSQQKQIAVFQAQWALVQQGLALDIGAASSASLQYSTSGALQGQTMVLQSGMQLRHTYTFGALNQLASINVVLIAADGVTVLATQTKTLNYGPYGLVSVT